MPDAQPFVGNLIQYQASATDWSNPTDVLLGQENQAALYPHLPQRRVRVVMIRDGLIPDLNEATVKLFRSKTPVIPVRRPVAGLEPPPLERPARLPLIPMGMRLSDLERKQRLELHMRYLQDPADALFWLDSLLGGKANAPTPKGTVPATFKGWLEQVRPMVSDRAIEYIRREHRLANARKDIHTSSLTAVIAGRIDPDLLKGEERARKGNCAHWLAGKESAALIWIVTDVKGRLVGPKYTEGDVTVAAKAGQNLLRVTATVQNISNTSDASYAAQASSSERGRVGRKEIDRGRFAVETLLCAVTQKGETIPCMHVCAGCKLRGPVLSVGTKEGRRVTQPTGAWIPKKGSYKLDVIFAVPNDVKGVRLWVFGAPLEPIETAKQKT